MAASGTLDTPSSWRPAWAEDSLPLREISAKHQLPLFVKVTKGHFMNVGPARDSHHSELLLHSVKTSVKVLAQSAKMKEGKRCKPLSQKISIPLDYEGWFEVLSEQGKAVNPLKTVKELMRKNPRRCLVRETVKGYPENSEGQVSAGELRMVQAGEVLTLTAEVNVTFRGKSGVTRYLQCTDSQETSVHLPVDSKGQFSPLASSRRTEAADVSSVYRIRELVDTFRLPFIVRLVRLSKAAKKQQNFAFRLLMIYSDETAFVTPLGASSPAEQTIVPICTNVAALRMVTATNMPEFVSKLAFKSLLERTASQVDTYVTSIHFLVDSPENWHRIQEARQSQAMSVKKKRNEIAFRSRAEEDKLFKEIDRIYLYVREGGLPPQLSGASGSNSGISGISADKQVQAAKRGWEEPAYEVLDQFRLKPSENYSQAGLPTPDHSSTGGYARPHAAAGSPPPSLPVLAHEYDVPAGSNVKQPLLAPQRRAKPETSPDASSVVLSACTGAAKDSINSDLPDHIPHPEGGGLPGLRKVFAPATHRRFLSNAKRKELQWLKIVRQSSEAWSKRSDASESGSGPLTN